MSTPITEQCQHAVSGQQNCGERAEFISIFNGKQYCMDHALKSDQKFYIKNAYDIGLVDLGKIIKFLRRMEANI
jgi:hypothetical protein